MKNSLLFSVALFLLMLTSCGKKDKLTPVTTSISGPLSSYFEVVDREYKVINNKVNVEIKRVSEGLPAPWTEGILIGSSDNKVEPGFSIELSDEDGDVVSRDETSIILEHHELESILALGVGESATIPFEASLSQKPEKFKIGSTFKYHEAKKAQSTRKSTATSDDDEDLTSLLSAAESMIETASSAASSMLGIYNEISDSESTNRSGSEDWDDVLNEYEKMVDEYIKLLKKANDGDLSAMTSYLTYMEKAVALSEKLSKAESAMTASQVSRYMRIVNKMAQAGM